jgi:hypothetical protein
MPVTRTLFILAGMAVFSACAGEPAKIIIQPETGPETAAPPLPPQEERAILDYQDAGAGRKIPEWLTCFLDQGIRGVEGLENYRDSYVFVAENGGANFTALGHWAAGFTPAQDFPRLAAVRVEERMLRTAVLYPDDEYGEFFEALVKKASDAVYIGAVKEESFWIKQRYSPDNAPGRERYVFFVLVTVKKSELQTQLRALLAEIHPAAPSREQAASINRLKETFFEDF